MLDNMEDKNPELKNGLGSALHRCASRGTLPIFKLISGRMNNKNPGDCYRLEIFQRNRDNQCVNLKIYEKSNK